MALPIRMPHLGPRTRKILRIAGLVVLFLVTFVFAVQWTFPFHRVRDKVVEVLSAKYEVQIAEVERGLIPGRVYFKNVTLRTRPAKADEVPTTFFINELQVDVGLLALLSSTASADFDARIATGHLTGTLAFSKGETSIHIDGENLPSASLPMKEAIGLPMSGKVNFSFDLDIPTEKLKNGRRGPNWTKAVGGATFKCPTGCTFGDGKTKLKPKLKNSRSQAFAEGGIEFGKLNVQSLTLAIDIRKGHLKVTKLDTKSEDGQLHVDFDMTLAQNIDQSEVDGCLRFTGSEALLKRDARTHAAISTTGAPLGPDNLYHIKLDGTIKQMKRLGKVCGSAAAGAGDDDSTPSRPSITIQPDAPLSPDAGTPSFAPPPAVDAAVEADAAVTVPTPGPEGETPDSPAPPAGSAGSAGAAPPGDVPPNHPAAGEPRAPAPGTGTANPVPEGMR